MNFDSIVFCVHQYGFERYFKDDSITLYMLFKKFFKVFRPYSLLKFKSSIQLSYDEFIDFCNQPNTILVKFFVDSDTCELYLNGHYTEIFLPDLRFCFNKFDANTFLSSILSSLIDCKLFEVPFEVLS